MSASLCPAAHKHGVNRTCYSTHGCRCTACREVNTATKAARLRAQAYGRYTSSRVPAGPALAHVQKLRRIGYGPVTIARIAGVTARCVQSLIYGEQGFPPSKRLSRENADRILAVRLRPDYLADGARVDARGVRRRLQALATLGYSQTRIGREMGRHQQVVNEWMTAERVTVRAFKDVAAAYERLSATHAPHETRREREVYGRVRNRAKAMRWVPPLGWDDIDNDVEPPVTDDEGGLDEMAVELAMSGERVRLRHDERREVIRRLNAVKLDDQEISRRMHVADRTVLRIRQELGLPAAVGADRQVVA